MSLVVFLGLLGALGFGAFWALSGQSLDAALGDLRDWGRRWSFQQGWVERLSTAEVTRLYQKSCTRRCHGREVVEAHPRTAAEWEEVLARMRAPDRANLDDRLAEAVLRHLQTHYLSNVPTVLPPEIMKFVKQHLWRSDFGESDLFLDIIFVPKEHASLLRYLGVRKLPQQRPDGVFVVFLNTHQGRVPKWNLAQLARLQLDGEAPRGAQQWQALYRDGQEHHEQGLLDFGPLPVEAQGAMTLTLQLGGLGTRHFVWTLPVPVTSH